MTENTELNPTVVAWINALAARGVTIELRGKSLAFRPKSAYSAMSDEERAVFKKHKAEIVHALEQVGGLVEGALPVTATHGPLETPPRRPTVDVYCRYCMRKCVGPEHPAFETFHNLDPLVIQRRVDEFRERQFLEWARRTSSRTYRHAWSAS